MKINKNMIKRLVKESLKEEKLSQKQSKVMDKDKDGDIDGKDLKSLRKNENVYRIVKEEYAKIKGSVMQEGARNDEWEMVDAVVAALGAEGALDALVRALPSSDVMDAMEYIGRMHEIPMEMDEETKPHEVDRHPPDTPADRIREETKPHENDRKPADTPEDRIRK